MPLKKINPDNIYNKLVNEEDARVCKAIDEKACKVVPGNFLLTIISYFLINLQMQLQMQKLSYLG